MAMNRRTRRHLQRQGEMAPDGTPVANRDRNQTTTASPTQTRAGFRQFLSEVRSELGKVVWPSRSELVNYSIVVLITIVVLTAMIAGFDWLFGDAVLRLFDTN